MNLRKLILITVNAMIFLVLLSYQACSDVGFSTSEDSVGKADCLALGNCPQSQDRVINYQQPSQNITNKVDLLFVTDTSGSLNTERGAIADSIDSFVAQLSPVVDYQFAVLLGHGSQSSLTGELYQKGNEDIVLKSPLQGGSLSEIRGGLSDKLRSPAGDGASDGGEEGLYSLDQLLSPAKFAQAQSEGFFRAGAAVAIVFIADENDICARYPAGITPVVDGNGVEPVAFIQDCGNVTADSVYLGLRNQLGDVPLLVSGIIYTDPQTVPSGGENEVGYGYTDIIGLNGNVGIDLAQGNFNAGLSQIGDLVSVSLNLKTTFILTVHSNEQVEQSSILVTVDGQSVPFNFVSSTNEIHLQNAGGPNSTVIINYSVVSN